MLSLNIHPCPSLQHKVVEDVKRGDVISFEGDRVNSSIVEWCEDKGANVVVKLIGESPLLVSKDRRVSVFPSHF